MLNRSILEFLVEHPPNRPELLKILSAVDQQSMPDAERRKSPLSPKQAEQFTRWGFDSTEGMRHGQCSDLWWIVKQRQERGLCTLPQLWFARSLTGNTTEDYTEAEARAILDRRNRKRIER